MLAILKPVVLAFLKSDKFRLFVVELLEKLVEHSHVFVLFENETHKHFETM